MQAIDKPFTKIINGTTQFVIPVFQRDYSWTESDCEQLWSDILRVAADPSDRGHFIGSIVYISTGDSSAGFTRWLLIDGQQRVATLTLLFAALRDHIQDTGPLDGHRRRSDNGPRRQILPQEPRRAARPQTQARAAPPVTKKPYKHFLMAKTCQ